MAREATAEGLFQPIPERLQNIPRLETTAVPLNITKGSSTDTSEIYVGDEVVRLLGDPRGVRVRSHADNVHAPRVQLMKNRT
jgi:hypothetical protein